MSHPAAAYWDQGVTSVPRMTGLRDGNLDPADLRDVCTELGIVLPVDMLLDVGCGTGRASVLADHYVGVDVSASAVQFCLARGVHAEVIDDPESVSSFQYAGFSWVWACSVFTHIGREERQQYLAQFARIAPNLLVDILPDCPRQDYAQWGADEAEFRTDLAAAGYRIEATAERRDDGANVTHRYFKAVRA
jgi:SAM-dependent methyltransferase